MNGPPAQIMYALGSRPIDVDQEVRLIPSAPTLLASNGVALAIYVNLSRPYTVLGAGACRVATRWRHGPNKKAAPKGGSLKNTIKSDF